MGTQQSTGNSEDALSSSIPAVHRQLQIHLRMLGHRLTTVRSVVSTVTLALREQNAEMDREIARVLRHCAGDALGVEIERIEALHDVLRGECVSERELMEAELAEVYRH